MAYRSGTGIASGATPHTLMEWSAIQGSIITKSGQLEDLYKAPNHPYTEDELPHYHKVRGVCTTVM